LVAKSLVLVPIGQPTELDRAAHGSLNSHCVF
jgi:hypothetical protein